MFGGSDPFANIRRLVQAPVQQMRTFQLAQPIKTHFRKATCKEVDCPNYANGWSMGFDLTDPERAKAARWIRDHSGRTMSAVVAEGKVTLTFPAGQECFTTHRVPLERDPFMVVRAGDFRGNPTGWRMRHTSAESFADQWSDDLDKLKTKRERG
jgi:hypothetical protein